MDLNLFRRVRSLFSQWEKTPGGDALLCSGWAYLTLWRTECLSRLTIDKLGFYPISTGLKFRLFLRDLLSLIAARAPVLVTSGDLPAKRRTLIFSWYHNTPDELLRDRYLGALAHDLDETTSRIYLCSANVHGPFEKNIDAYFVQQRRLSWNLRWLALALGSTLSRPWRPTAWLSAWSVERRNAVFLRRQIEAWISSSHGQSVETLIFPYEQQPWQCELIHYFRSTTPTIDIVGYIHSSLNNLPSQFVKHAHTPNRLFVHGEAYRRVLAKYLGWESHSIVTIPSLRFTRALKIERSTIFLPYGFTEPKLILNSLQKIRDSGVGLRGADIRLHPDKREVPAHLELKGEIERIISDASAAEKISVVTVGVSTVTLEALEAGCEVYAIFEDPGKDALPGNLWDEIIVRPIDGHCFRYELKERRAFIALPLDEESSFTILRHSAASKER